MNLLEAKKKALSLMAEYSVDGVPIPDGENADYLNRMNRFANDAQMEISDKIGIEATSLITQAGESTEGYNKYDLPADFKEHRYMNQNDERFKDYRIENSKIYLRKVYDGTFEFFYYKDPQELDSTTLDTYEFEVAKHTQPLIPYFMGGMSITDENPNLADRLLNLYYSKFSSIEDKKNNYPSQVENVYSM
jgi:hypothetical protein